MSVTIDDIRRKLGELSESPTITVASTSTTASSATSDSGLADDAVGLLSGDKTGRPQGFGRVIDGIYRSSYPREEDYDFVRDLKLKTVVTLVDKDAPEGYHPFLKANNINHIIVDMKGTKKQSIPLETMRQILAVVMNKANHPLLVHCNQGRHRTGCVAAIIRKASGMPLNGVLDEYRAYAEPKVRDIDVEYIAEFDVINVRDIIPAMIPRPRNRAPVFWKYFVFALIVLALWGLSTYRFIRGFPRRQIRPAQARGSRGDS